MSSSENLEHIRGSHSESGATVEHDYKNRKVTYHPVSDSDLRQLGSLNLNASFVLALASLLIGVSASSLLTHFYAADELRAANCWMAGIGVASGLFGVALAVWFFLILKQRTGLMLDIKKNAVDQGAADK